MRLPHTYYTKRLVLAISQVVVGNCREFEVVITDQQLVINEKQTWCHPAEDIWRFEPRAGTDDETMRVDKFANGERQFLPSWLGSPACVFLSCCPESDKRALGLRRGRGWGPWVVRDSEGAFWRAGGSKRPRRPARSRP